MKSFTSVVTRQVTSQVTMMTTVGSRRGLADFEPSRETTIIGIPLTSGRYQARRRSL